MAENSEFCSTTTAAKMLGISVGTVQQLVENGKLQAWKTAGGHRRILLHSVEELLQSQSVDQPATAVKPMALSVIVVEDDPVLLKGYQRMLEKTAIPLQIELFDNGLDAMLRLGSGFPDLLILDLEVPFIDGFEMLRRLQKLPTVTPKHIVVITGLTHAELASHKHELQNVTLLSKPATPAFLEGYLHALHRC